MDRCDQVDQGKGLRIHHTRVNHIVRPSINGLFVQYQKDSKFHYLLKVWIKYI